jgi:predicted transcriptional regulator
MSETLSIRIDPRLKSACEGLSKRSKRSKSFLAAEAIAAYRESEEWRRGELQAGIADLGSGQTVSHEEVSKWLNSWGKPDEENRKRKFLKRLKANLAQDDPHRQDRLVNEFRTLILGR